VGHIAYKIPDDLHQRARVAAAQQGRTFKSWIERAILAAVEEHETAEEKRRRR
jgi:predicted HicB family RNase H-like nuclease